MIYKVVFCRVVIAHLVMKDNYSLWFMPKFDVTVAVLLEELYPLLVFAAGFFQAVNLKMLKLLMLG